MNKNYVDNEFVTKTDSSIVKNNQTNDFDDNIITNVRSIQINNIPINNSDGVNKKYVDDNIDQSTILRLNDDSNERYLQARVGNTAYNLKTYTKRQIINYSY